jgi:outer membrane protein TolC
MFGLSAWRRFRGQLLGGLAVPGLLAVTADLMEHHAGPAHANSPSLVAPALPPVPVLDLAACKTRALAQQPAIAAAQASYTAAVARQHALDTIRLPHFLIRDLPARKQQAATGLSIAGAEVHRVQLDTLYGVTYAYLSAQYAVEQRQLLDESRDQLNGLLEGVKLGLTTNKTNVRKDDIPQVEAYQLIVQSRREEAILGEQRALSALREAMGIDCHAPLLLSATAQFRVQPVLDKEAVVCEALARRPEILQASLLVQVHDLEADAQAARKFLPQVTTFAYGGDIHSRPLPAGSYDENYSPAAVGPEMPAALAGSKSSRVEVAQIYTQRAGNAADKTRNLIRLETEQAYLRYLEASRRLPVLIEARKRAQKYFRTVKENFQKGERNTTVRDWLSAGSLVTDLRSQVNTTRYQMLIALARIERATAGGFCASFETAPTSDSDENAGNSKNDRTEKTEKGPEQ